MTPRHKSRPPRLSESFLKRIFPDNGDLTTLGDLEEVFNSIADDKGKFRARLWYRRQTFLSVSSFLKNSFFWSLWMFKNYLNFTLRLVKRDRFHYSLNFLGLATGIACSIIILLFLRNELTYDRFHENADRIYRISSNYVTSGEPVLFAISSPALGPHLEREYPEIEAFVRIAPLSELFFSFEDKRFYERGIVFADQAIMQVFTYPLLQGDAETCLSEPNTIVLSERLAHKYFGDENPLGQLIQGAGRLSLKVTGVMQNPPQNAHIPIEGMISYVTWETPNKAQEWPIYEVYGYTYVMFPEGYSLDAFFSKFPAFYEKHIKKDEPRYNQVFEPIFIKLADVHYNTVGFRGDLPLGNRAYLYAFFFIGIFILILACINYINMTTARSATRAKEIGMKKVLGSKKKNLVSQILGESILITFAALVIAYGSVWVLLSFTGFDSSLDLGLNKAMLFHPLLILVLLGVCLLVGITSGLYPAFYLSSIAPVAAIAGKFSTSRRGIISRRALVVFQFVISIGVVILTLFMNRQIDFMRNQDLGFNKENVLSIRLRDPEILPKLPAFKEQLLRNPNVTSAALGIGHPGSPSGGLYKFEGPEGMEEHNFAVFFAGFDYLETMGLEIAAGRDFDKNFASDRQEAVIVNETLIKFMGWENPIGKRVQQLTYFDGHVIGVVKDFHFRSLHNKIEPIIIRMMSSNRGGFFVRLKAENLVQTMGFLETQWKELNPNRPFISSFLDDQFDQQYNADRRQNRLVKIFSYICILISCLGLLGLSSFTSQRRTKEVAIRKVLGASSPQIVLIMFREIFILVTMASIAAVPISLVFINMWLGNFAYRTNLNILIFASASLGAILVAFLTASYHSIKVAQTHPAKNLKYE